MGAWHGMMASLNSEFPEAERGLHERRRVPELGGEALRERPGADDGYHRGVGLGIERHHRGRRRRGQGRGRAQHHRLQRDEPVPELRPLITAAGRRRHRCRSNSRCRGRRRLAATLEIHGAIGGQEM